MQPPDYPTLIKLLYDWQTLAAGILAIIAALIAAWPVWRQLETLKAQAAVMARDGLIARLGMIEARRNATREKIANVRGAIFQIRQPYEDEEDAAEISPPWAFDTERTAELVQGFLAAHQESSLDSALIDAARKVVIDNLEALSRCLYRIHAPDSNDFQGPDFHMNEKEIEDLKKDAESAKGELEEKFSAVSESAGKLDAAFVDELQQLRSRIRGIDALVGDGNASIA